MNKIITLISLSFLIGPISSDAVAKKGRGDKIVSDHNSHSSAGRRKIDTMPHQQPHHREEGIARQMREYEDQLARMQNEIATIQQELSYGRAPISPDYTPEASAPGLSVVKSLG